MRESSDGPLNSKIVEDSFKALAEMVKDQRNLKVQPKKAFVHLIDGEVLHGAAQMVCGFSSSVGVV